MQSDEEIECELIKDEKIRHDLSFKLIILGDSGK